jgi:YbbR domain-containing protein
LINVFKRYVLHNLGLKVLSLVLATGLWLAIARDPVAEVAIRVPIEFMHMGDNLEISSEQIPEAQIRVRGPGRLIRQLRATDVHAELDLRDAKPGERTFDLNAQEIRRPQDVEVVQVVPSQVHLAFDTRLTREVEIHPRVTGTFIAGLQIARVEADPERVTITGPRHHVERVESATTDPVDASGTRSRQTFTTNVYVADPLVQVLQPTSTHVTVTMEAAGPSAH